MNHSSKRAAFSGFRYGTEDKKRDRDRLCATVEQSDQRSERSVHL
jgi:hypothetical protein